MGAAVKMGVEVEVEVAALVLDGCDWLSRWRTDSALVSHWHWLEEAVGALRKSECEATTEREASRAVSGVQQLQQKRVSGLWTTAYGLQVVCCYCGLECGSGKSRVRNRYGASRSLLVVWRANDRLIVAALRRHDSRDEMCASAEVKWKRQYTTTES